MRILLYSPVFLPRLGGLEIGQALLSEGLSRLGHEVTVVTQTAARDRDDFPFRLVRRPGPLALLREMRACDVYFQANVSLRGLWPLLLVRRPWAVSHHSWYCRTNGRVSWRDRLKRYLLRFAACSISVSRAIAADLATPSLVIPNAYRDRLFRILPGARRPRELAFLGRLVSDKGADVLLSALARLGQAGLRPRLTVIGDGPELSALRAQAATLGLVEQVEFAGEQQDEQIVRRLNEHRILVVPSRYHEPFGVVALEGIACGCVVVGSAGGGLPEAMGPCGRSFRNGDAEDLAAVLAALLERPEEMEALRAGAAEHLARHGSEQIARLYAAALAEGLTMRGPARRPSRERAT